MGDCAALGSTRDAVAAQECCDLGIVVERREPDVAGGDGVAVLHQGGELLAGHQGARMPGKEHQQIEVARVAQHSDAVKEGTVEAVEKYKELEVLLKKYHKNRPAERK